jgi:chromosome partitioning protein
MAINVSFINMKGGVGKTTLAMQIALAADQADKRILAVDLDPQANLSQAILGLKPYRKLLADEKPTVIQLFEGYRPSTTTGGGPTTVGIEDVIIKGASHFQNSSLDLIPSRLELSQTLRSPAQKERRLAKALSKVSEAYDLIIIDCAPTDSVLTDAAYFASRYVLIPIKPEYMATIGLPLLARSLDAFKKENDDHKIDICGIVFNHSSSYTSGPETKQSTKEVREFAKDEGWKVFASEVSYSRSYAKSAREGMPVGRTSHVRGTTRSSFRTFRDEFFASIGFTV